VPGAPAGGVNVAATLASDASAGRASDGKVLRPAAFQLDDAALVALATAGHRDARAAVFDRHGAHVRRVLGRLLGADAELADLLHDVFVEALQNLRKLRDPSALKAWLTRIAVHLARRRIRQERRRRWLRLVDRLPDPPAPAVSDEVTEALAATYEILTQLPLDERIAFALRIVDGMELKEAAEACGTSLATFKRRLRRAEDGFVERAVKHPALREWIEGGDRWAVT
jgi:RNA polymerase sigma-70 factor, ECF subfamily